MSNINNVVVSGNLTRDAEVRATNSGNVVITFGIAVNERRKSGDEWSDYTNFFNCVMFGTRAEKLAQYLKKGRKVILSGKLAYSQWQTTDGTKKSKVEITVLDIDFAGSRQEQGQTQQAVPVAQTPAPAPRPAVQAPAPAPGVQMFDEDIPF